MENVSVEDLEAVARNMGTWTMPTLMHYSYIMRDKSKLFTAVDVLSKAHTPCHGSRLLPFAASSRRARAHKSHMGSCPDSSNMRALAHRSST